MSSASRLHRLMLLFPIIVCLCAGFYQLRKSPTYDELAHLAAGVNLYRHLDYRQYHVNPPIAKFCFTPLAAISNLEVPKLDSEALDRSRPEMDIGDQVLELNQEKALQELLYARGLAVLLSSTGCVLMYFLLSNLYDTTVGLAGAILWSFTPMIIGHGSLITADVPATLAVLLCLIQTLNWRKHPSIQSSILLGISLGIGLCTKFTLLILVGAIAVFAFTLHVDEALFVKRTVKSLERLGIVASTAMLLVWLIFLGDGFGRRLSSVTFDSSLMQMIHSNVCAVVPSIWIPLPEQYLEGIDTQLLDHTTEDQPTFFMGTWYSGKPLGLYAVGILLKSPIALTALLVLRFVDMVVIPPNRIEQRNTLLLLLPGFILLFILEMQSQFQTPVRYAIPALMLFVGWSLGVLRSAGGQLPRWATFRRYAGMLLIALYTVEGSSGFSDPIAYFNVASGGSNNGFRQLPGSNVEWGQNLAEFKRYQSKYRDEKLYVWVVARDAVLDFYLGEHTRFYGNRYGFHGTEEHAFRPGYYLVEGTHLMDQSRASAELRKLNPIDRIGSAYFVYRIDAETLINF